MSWSGRNLKRIGNSVSISLPTDEKNLTERRCPNPECEKYFKIEFGTGLTGEDLKCHCPYCGITGDSQEFHSPEQIEYAKSIAFDQISRAIHKDFEDMARGFNARQKRNSFINMKMNVSKGKRTRIEYYDEKDLETEVVCTNCTLHYSIYGVFGYCPDCGIHNSFQIFEANLRLVAKMLDIAPSIEDKEVSSKLIENALEDSISSFEAFGKEICIAHTKYATNPDKVRTISFHNLGNTNKNLLECFGFDLTGALSPEEWSGVTMAFQKRHLVSHRMGVIDAAYINQANDLDAILGRKVRIPVAEINDLIKSLHTLGAYLTSKLTASGKHTDGEI